MSDRSSADSSTFPARSAVFLLCVRNRSENKIVARQTAMGPPQSKAFGESSHLARFWAKSRERRAYRPTSTSLGRVLRRIQRDGGCRYRWSTSLQPFDDGQPPNCDRWSSPIARALAGTPRG